MYNRCFDSLKFQFNKKGLSQVKRPATVKGAGYLDPVVNLFS